MSSSNSVTVQILDKEYSIICPQEERSNLVMMAALNITHDLLHKQERPDVQASGSTREQVRDLLERVDLVLSSDSDAPKG
ncbi:cell division protein ZapA [Pseudomonas sp. NZIPFR-PS2]|nr:cell division protein ZapA [Pseudomonas sp. NZIPFR-PS2]